jgi:acetate kinase
VAVISGTRACSGITNNERELRHVYQVKNDGEFAREQIIERVTKYVGRSIRLHQGATYGERQ